MNRFFNKKYIRVFLSVVLILCLFTTCFSASALAESSSAQFESTDKNISSFGTLLDYAQQFIVIKHKQLGGSHYAYTAGISDERDGIMGTENNFDPGSEMVLVTLENRNGTVYRKEETLLESRTGVLRDPDVSEDGTKALFSWKKNRTDDYHLYEMNIASKSYTQLTFGAGIADVEPKYLAGGKIVFSSSRCIEYVDCWHTPVLNTYTCNADGTNIVRVGYDQVHTTYPTVTEDGRVLYTRWDYNDRTQMYIQSVFQMFGDGTNQTEVFGNNSNFPTTLLHTRDIPGSPGVYISISSGHHTHQKGKPVLIDTTKGRNNKTLEGERTDAISYLFPDERGNKSPSTMEDDQQNQTGPQYKYPYALNINEYLISYTASHNNDRNTQYKIYYFNIETDEKIELCAGSTAYGGASQIVPIKSRTLFERPSMVNNSVDTGTYYIGNVYEGDGMVGVEMGAAKYLRIVALEFRSSSIGATVGNGVGSSDQFSPVSTGNGAWDVKRVLGIVDIEEDGSALFKVPSNTPVYFQVLNADGELIQSMRSWSTVMSNEVFSCVGCHEDKNTVPPMRATTSIAMDKGVQTIRPDLWMKSENPDTYDAAEDSTGFSYTEVVQPILDNNCISCHSNTSTALFATGAKLADSAGDPGNKTTQTIFATRSRDWKYYTEEITDDSWYAVDFDDSSWETGRASFGDGKTTRWNSNNLYIRRTFTVDNMDDLNDVEILLRILFDESPKVYLNGALIFETQGYVGDYTDEIVTSAFMKNIKSGENVIAASAVNTAGGQSLDVGFYSMAKDPNAGDSQISLESTAIEGSRERFNYTLSYLVLTASKTKGDQFQGNSSNKYTNWISSMSQAEILDPYQYGSTQSAVIQKLKSGHVDGLSVQDIQAIAAWIDLGVPFRGSYDEAVTWGTREYEEFQEKEYKRAYYDTADKVTKQVISGVYPTDTLPLTLKYTNSNGEDIGTITDSGLVTLYLEKKLTAGNKVTVTLPEGVEYFFLCLNPRLPEALIYCPSGEYTYEIPSDAKDVFPSSVMSVSYPEITARIASEKDLTSRRNLAVNPYDLSADASSYPHATASNVYENASEFSARNAIDGYTINVGHGTYPVQSWGPSSDASDLWYQIDFGKNVYASSIGITMRFDKKDNHDTIFTKAVLEFSDGSTQEIQMTETADKQVFNFDGGIKETSYVKIRSLEKGEGDWASFTEVEVSGTVNKVLLPTIESLTVAGDVSWNKNFSSGTFEYDLKVSKGTESIKFRDLDIQNADSVVVRVDDTDVVYIQDSGFSVDTSKDSVVKVILSNSAGDVTYIFNVKSSASSNTLTIVLIAAGAALLLGGGAAGFFIVKGKKKGKKK